MLVLITLQPPASTPASILGDMASVYTVGERVSVVTSNQHYLALLITYCRWRSKPRWLERLTTDTTNWLVRLLVVLPQQA